MQIPAPMALAATLRMLKLRHSQSSIDEFPVEADDMFSVMGTSEQKNYPDKNFIGVRDRIPAYRHVSVVSTPCW